MLGWDEVRKWRCATRAELLSRRLAVPREEKLRIRSTVRDLVGAQISELRDACIGFYWPFKGEIDLRHLVRDFLALGAAAALPVVVEKQQPLEFWAWQPHMKLQRGFWNIPVPAERNPVRPTALLVPLVGFDAMGYRLGYGGGYYDRTLAGLDPKPLTIGVGFELGRLETIYPQQHDIPLDVIVTEAGHARHRYCGQPLDAAKQSGEAANRDVDDMLDQALDETFPVSAPFDLSHDDAAAYASPPCFMHELDPTYLGFMSATETIALLNALLENERAGSRGTIDLANRTAGLADHAILDDIAQDGARYCAMLTRHIKRLGGIPSPETGTFYEKLIALETSCERLDLLNRCQAWGVRKLRDALPNIDDSVLQHDLKNMLEVHERHIRHCADLASQLQ